MAVFQNQVQVLTDKDFSDDKTLTLKTPHSEQIVLFYYNPFDEIVHQWGAKIAIESIYPHFSAVHLLSEATVRKSLNDILNNKSNPLHAKLNDVFANKPFILYYKDGKVSELYNGSTKASEVIKYSLLKLNQ